MQRSVLYVMFVSSSSGIACFRACAAPFLNNSFVLHPCSVDVQIGGQVLPVFTADHDLSFGSRRDPLTVTDSVGELDTRTLSADPAVRYDYEPPSTVRRSTVLTSYDALPLRLSQMKARTTNRVACDENAVSTPLCLGSTGV